MATQMFIGGTWTDGMAKQTQRVTSPATGEPLGEVPISTAADIDAAVKAAKKAQRELDAMTVFERSALCHRVAELLESRVDELARELALEQGKPFATEAREEIHHSAGNFRLHAEEGIRLDTEVMPSETRGKLLFTLRGVSELGVYDERGVLEKYGVPAARYVEFAILRGDPSDGLPGVRGVGEKTARDLVQAFPSIDAMLEAAEAGAVVIKPGVRAKLLDARAYIEDMQRLVPVHTDAPLSLWAGERDDDGLLADAPSLGLKGPIQRLLAALDSTHAV